MVYIRPTLVENRGHTGVDEDAASGGIPYVSGRCQSNDVGRDSDYASGRVDGHTVRGAGQEPKVGRSACADDGAVRHDDAQRSVSSCKLCQAQRPRQRAQSRVECQDATGVKGVGAEDELLRGQGATAEVLRGVAAHEESVSS